MIQRHLSGFGPVPSDRLSTEYELPDHLWDIALALTDQGSGDDYAGMGDYSIPEDRARAIASVLGCTLPPQHHWYICTSAKGT